MVQNLNFLIGVIVLSSFDEVFKEFLDSYPIIRLELFARLFEVIRRDKPGWDTIARSVGVLALGDFGGFARVLPELRRVFETSSDEEERAMASLLISFPKINIFRSTVVRFMKKGMVGSISPIIVQLEEIKDVINMIESLDESFKQVKKRVGDIIGDLTEELGMKLFVERELVEEPKKLLQIALEAAILSNNPLREALIRNNLGAIYHSSGEQDKAIENFEKSLRILESLSEAGGADIENEIAMLHKNLGVVYSDLNEYDKAESHYMIALDLFSKLAAGEPEQYEQYVAEIHFSISELYIERGELEEARDHLRKSLQIYEKLSKIDPEKYGEMIKEVKDRLNRIERAKSDS